MSKQRTMVFWLGLILLSLAAIELFGVVWMTAVVMYPANRMEFLKGLVPLIVGGIVFLFIGAYMMRSSHQKKTAIKGITRLEALKREMENEEEG